MMARVEHRAPDPSVPSPGMPSVTRRSQQGREARRRQARNRLLQVVERLLGDGESFTELSVERIVAEAGMARSTFYVYFEDKGDLLRRWFAGITDELRAAAASWWQLGPAPTAADVRDALRAIVTTYRPHTTLMAAVYDAARTTPRARPGDDDDGRERRRPAHAHPAGATRASSTPTWRPPRRRRG